MAKVFIRLRLPAERAFADLLRHLHRCHQCTASMCLGDDLASYQPVFRVGTLSDGPATI